MLEIAQFKCDFNQQVFAKNMAAGFFIIDDYEPMCTISLSFYSFIQSYELNCASMTIRFLNNK